MNQHLYHDLLSYPQILEQVKLSAESFLQNLEECPTAVLPPQLALGDLPNQSQGTLRTMETFATRFGEKKATAIL
jgi:hypothetical protein